VNINRIRLAASIILLYLMMLMEYPLPTIVISIVLVVAYFIIRNAPDIRSDRYTNYSGISSQTRAARLAALETASMYLAPYKSIWRDLKLTNKFCSAKLGHDGGIHVTEKQTSPNASYRTFKVLLSGRVNMQEIWNAICLNFGYFTNYDDLSEQCRLLFNVQIRESIIGNEQVYKTSEMIKNKQSEQLIKVDNLKEKIDVNNASEVELTELPGISIVMSKRIIKKREEIGGFKTLNDFFIFIKVKPHMEEQLKNIVCVNEMKGSIKIEHYQERHIDF